MFDSPQHLNDDGTVTITAIPSNWHRFNISPDTYQSFNGDSWVESELEYRSEELGRDLSYDDFTWTYDHSGIVRDLSQELANWLAETLADLGIDATVELRDTWSPQFYNFQSDGFEVDVTLDPVKLRELTTDFDVDAWASKHYSSRDGFLSYVTGRMNDDDWRDGYDGEFRLESLLADADVSDFDGGWFMRLAEAEWEIYSENVVVEYIEPEYLDSGFTLSELEEWAREIAPHQDEQL